MELNILNSLIGSKNIEEDFERIVTKYPETLSCIPLLLAVRGYEIYAQNKEGAFRYNFKRIIIAWNNTKCLCVRRDCLT